MMLVNLYIIFDNLPVESVCWFETIINIFIVMKVVEESIKQKRRVIVLLKIMLVFAEFSLFLVLR